MATVKNIEDLEAWQESKKLCVGIYIITNRYPNEEKYNLIKHLKESGRGVMGNIGEGFGRYFFKESMQFYNIAKGCLGEIKSDILLSYELGYINEFLTKKFIAQINKTDNKIGGLIAQTKKQIKNFNNL